MLALGQIIAPELAESLLQHIGTLNEFGGEVYIGAARARFDAQGRKLQSNGKVLVEVPTQAGTEVHEREPTAPVGWTTYAHIVGYNKTARIKGQEVEPDAPYESQPAPDPVEPEPERRNGEVPEPVAAEG